MTNPKGKPPLHEGERQERRNVRLSDRYMDIAKRLGNGNATTGIRLALEMAENLRASENDKCSEA